MVVKRKGPNTDQAEVSLFRPHGRVEYSVSGNVLIADAYGPFNVQLIGAVNSIEKETLQSLAQQGTWGMLLCFHDSALASLEVLQAFTELLTQNRMLGLIAHATAIVLPSTVEGAALMAPLYIKCYANATSTPQLFEEVDAAEAWLRGQLGAGAPA